LVTQRSNVGETAERVCGDEAGASGEAVVLGVGLESGVGDELVLKDMLEMVLSEKRWLETYSNELETNKLSNLEQVTVAANTEKEGDRITYVSEDQVQCKRGIVDVQVPTPPGEKAVDESNQTDNTQQSCCNHTGNFNTKPGALGKGVENVRGLLVRVLRDDDSASGKGLLLFRPAQFGDCERGGDTHHTRGNEGLRVDSHL
jgi:hypothetical protein